MVLEPRTLEERRRPPSGGRLGDSRAWKGSQLIPGGTALDQVVATLVKNVQGLPSLPAPRTPRGVASCCTFLSGGPFGAGAPFLPTVSPHLGPRPQGDVAQVIRRHPRDQDETGWSPLFTAVIQGGIAVEHFLVSGTVSSTFHAESHFSHHKPLLKRTPFHPSHFVKEKWKLRQVKFSPRWALGASFSIRVTLARGCSPCQGLDLAACKVSAGAPTLEVALWRLRGPGGRWMRMWATLNAGSLCLYPLQALHHPRGGAPDHALQHGRVRQRLQRQPLEGQQVLPGSELGLRPLPASAHTAQPVPVSGGQLPAVARHGEKLLPPLPAPAVPLHGLLLTLAGPPWPLSAPVHSFKYEQRKKYIL